MTTFRRLLDALGSPLPPCEHSIAVSDFCEHCDSGLPDHTQEEMDFLFTPDWKPPTPADLEDAT